MTLLKKFTRYWLWVLIPSVIGIGIWQTTQGAINWHRGIYGGFHGIDARHAVAQQFLDEYGLTFFDNLTPKGEVKTHLGGLGPQVRVYRFTSPKGVAYCGSIWGGAGDTHIVITKGESCERLLH